MGRYGDIIQLLPAFKAIYDRTAVKPIVITATDYANIYDGVSYVTPFPVHWSWWEGVPQARRLASEKFGGGVVLQWWADEPFKWNPKAYQQLLSEGAVVLQSHGLEWGVDMHVAPTYGHSMWTRAGFSPDEMMSLPLVFDRRDPGREMGLVRQHRGIHKKPIVLVNFTGHSSPFAPHPEVMGVVSKFYHHFHFIDLGRVRADRIYDLLGLYDAAVGMITTDTATLHLAATGTIPYVAYTVGSPGHWNSSVPKGNCVLEIKYDHAIQKLTQLERVLEVWSKQTGAEAHPMPYGAGGGGVLKL